MKVKLLVTALALIASANSFAEGHIAYDYATVVDAEPIVRTVRISTPREECWQEDVTYRDRSNDSNAVGTVIGGVVGGAIGNAVGHRNTNKKVGAVVGAVLGATLGHEIAKSNDRQTVTHGTEERCKVFQDYQEEERIVGYRVRYRYNDETYSTRTDSDPGDTIKIRLAISPVI